MNPDAKVCITEDEAQLYDRQIRLWGLDAQKRLRAARVLLVGLRGLGCEVAKNLVLAGINSLLVLDHEPLSPEDLSSQFLAPQSSLGINRAEASLQRLQRLNPMVEVKTDKSELSSKPKEFFKDNFDIVIVTNCPHRDVLTNVNKICRESGIKFFAGDVFGFFGYCFIDLVFHEFVEEIKVQDQAKSAPRKIEVAKSKNGKENSEPIEVLIDDDAPMESEEVPAKKAKLTEDVVASGDVEKTKNVKTDKEEEAQTKMVKRRMRFPSLENALNFNWMTKRRATRVKKMDPSFFILQIILEFQSREGASPSVSNRDKNLDLLNSLHKSITNKFGLAENKIPEEIIPLLFSELSPVAAIVGGVLAQEVIKAISNRDTPLKNFFFYNPVESAGVVEIIGKSKEKFPQN